MLVRERNESQSAQSQKGEGENSAGNLRFVFLTPLMLVRHLDRLVVCEIVGVSRYAAVALVAGVVVTELFLGRKSNRETDKIGTNQPCSASFPLYNRRNVNEMPHFLFSHFYLNI